MEANGGGLAQAWSRGRAVSVVLGLIAIGNAANLVLALGHVFYLLAVAGKPGVGAFGTWGAISMSAFGEIPMILDWIDTIARVLCCVLFLRWVSAAFRAALERGARPVRYAAIHATLGFFIPLLNFVRPYQALRALNAAVDPAGLPDPPPRPDAGEHALGYREPAAAPSGAAGVPQPPLVAWWAFWLVMGTPAWLKLAAMDSWAITRLLDALAYEMTALDALLAILVVRRITGRLLAYASKKQSGDAGVDGAVPAG
jgi:hypothetical protein